MFRKKDGGHYRQIVAEKVNINQTIKRKYANVLGSGQLTDDKIMCIKLSNIKY